MSAAKQNQSNQGALAQKESKGIKRFFGASAFLAILILGLMILVFLWEAGNFISLYRDSLQRYRESGYELVDLAKSEREDYLRLIQNLDAIRADWLESLEKSGIVSPEERGKQIAQTGFDTYRTQFYVVQSDLLEFILEQKLLATEYNQALQAADDLNDSIEALMLEIELAEAPGPFIAQSNSASILVRRIQNAQRESKLDFVTSASHRRLMKQLESGEALLAKEQLLYIQFAQSEIASVKQILQTTLHAEKRVRKADFISEMERINAKLAADLERTVESGFNHAAMPPLLKERNDQIIQESLAFISDLPKYETAMHDWDPADRIGLLGATWQYLSGKKWIVANGHQNWFGLLPLLIGSLLVTSIALFIAAPIGIGSAIYINRLAPEREKRFFRPFVDFMSALPTVLIGFFGLMIFGNILTFVSSLPLFAWLPGFPILERLNALTAGCLLAVMIVPTIFILSEKVLAQLPYTVEEASFGLGASRWHTIGQITLPSAAPGFAAALLLSFSRAIGETMIVLLCTGNRIAIPNFPEGVGVLVQPVHTMTGIIAQEMGEVVQGGLHYRALFMTAVVLFGFTLCINISAQKILSRFGTNAQLRTKQSR